MVNLNNRPLSLQWNQLILDAIKFSKLPPPLAARALAMVHTAMYDAWSVYNSNAISTCTAMYINAPQNQCNKETVRIAFSFAAYRVLTDLFWLILPSENKNMFSDFMCSLGYNTDNTEINNCTPQGIGNLIARLVIESRNGDFSNPHGTLSMPTWSDYTKFKSITIHETKSENSRCIQEEKKESSSEQDFPLSHWGLVRPFALKCNWQFRPDKPCDLNEKALRAQAQEILDISACLTDEQKAIAEYWSDGTGTYTPPGHWCEIAQYVLRHEKRNTPCIKLLFALSNALLDVSIAAWECKRYYNYPRPVTVIRHLFENENVQAWAGPCKGTRTIQGKQWQSYIETPPFPEYVSEHAAFSRAAAVVLKNFTGSDVFEGCYLVKKGSSTIEPSCKTPCTDINLTWSTFSDAAIQAGMSGMYGGINFKKGNEEGQKLGNLIGTQTWEKALFYFNEQESF